MLQRIIAGECVNADSRTCHLGHSGPESDLIAMAGARSRRIAQPLVIIDEQVDAVADLERRVALDDCKISGDMRASPGPIPRCCSALSSSSSC